MIFFVIIPVLAGAFGNFLIPLMIGADDMAFPRMNALSYWLVPPVAVTLLLSPFLGGQCRFYPSCSRYALECLALHGAARGSLLSVIRVCKCHPLHPGGHDPPPPRLAPPPPSEAP